MNMTGAVSWLSESQFLNLRELLDEQERDEPVSTHALYNMAAVYLSFSWLGHDLAIWERAASLIFTHIVFRWDRAWYMRTAMRTRLLHALNLTRRGSLERTTSKILMENQRKLNQYLFDRESVSTLLIGEDRPFVHTFEPSFTVRPPTPVLCADFGYLPPSEEFMKKNDVQRRNALNKELCSAACRVMSGTSVYDKSAAPDWSRGRDTSRAKPSERMCFQPALSAHFFMSNPPLEPPCRVLPRREPHSDPFAGLFPPTPALECETLWPSVRFGASMALREAYVAKKLQCEKNEDEERGGDEPPSKRRRKECPSASDEEEEEEKEAAEYAEVLGASTSSEQPHNYYDPTDTWFPLQEYDELERMALLEEAVKLIEECCD